MHTMVHNAAIDTVTAQSNEDCGGTSACGGTWDVECFSGPPCATYNSKQAARWRGTSINMNPANDWDIYSMIYLAKHIFSTLRKHMFSREMYVGRCVPAPMHPYLSDILWNRCFPKYQENKKSIIFKSIPPSSLPSTSSLRRELVDTCPPAAYNRKMVYSTHLPFVKLVRPC